MARAAFPNPVASVGSFSTPQHFLRYEKLRELFRLLPKHKGTEKLQAELKQKISRAKDDLEGAKAGAKKGGVSHRVPREGAGLDEVHRPPARHPRPRRRRRRHHGFPSSGT